MAPLLGLVMSVTRPIPGRALRAIARCALVALGSCLVLSGPGCGRKGDPVPHPRALPGPCGIRMLSLRRLAVRLPERDAAGARLAGVERVRVYYVPVGASRPEPAEVLARGEIVLERSRPDLPGPGESLDLDLAAFRRPRGWLVIVAVRVGEVVGQAAEVLPWLDPEL